MQVKMQQLELDMEQQTGSKSGKEYIKAVYCHPTYLTYMQSTSCQMLDWMEHKLKFEKVEEPEIKLPTFYFSFIDYTKAFDHVDLNKLENSSRDGNTRPS